MRHARLLFPALRWTEAAGFERDRPLIEQSLALGAGGFCIFGGTAEGVRALTTELHQRSAHPLLIASDLERGAGQQFRGCTPLPPLAALGALDDVAVTARAAEITAREARALGVNWVYAPVADVDLEPRNPIVGTRSFGTEPRMVARHVVAWIRGAQNAGVLCCVKHFPGHGRTTEDSHATLPQVRVASGEMEADLLPFRAAIGAGVASVMTAHVAYDAWDAGMPATLSRVVVDTLLRQRLGFHGLVVTDALVMDGVLAGAGDEVAAAKQALRAGCDALLYPGDVAGVAAAVQGQPGADEAWDRVDLASRAVAAGPDNATRQGFREEDRDWAAQTARRCCRVLRGSPVAARHVSLLTLDDDIGGPYPSPSREGLAGAFRNAGVSVETFDLADPVITLSGAPVIALYSDIRAWKGLPGLSTSARERMQTTLAHYPDATVVLFGHPRLLGEDLPARHVLCAWGGEPIMQHAAAAWLVGASV